MIFIFESPAADFGSIVFIRLLDVEDVITAVSTHYTATRGVKAEPLWFFTRLVDIQVQISP